METHNEAFYNMSSNNIYNLFISSNCRIVTDSRSIEPGDIFFALRGERFNGNDFVPDALNRGARIVVADDPAIKSDRVIIVEDALAELQLLASRYRQSLDIPVMAITGTNGKTTTRELITAVLSTKYRIHSTRGNLNNHIGVPLTLLSAPPDTSFLLVEMGANHIGEIDSLCRIADPGYGIITNIGRAHLEGFGSPEGVITAKSELYRYLYDNGGQVLYNSDNELLAGIVNTLGVKGIPYNHPGDTDIRILKYSAKPALSLGVLIKGSEYIINTRLFGVHNLENVMAAIAAGILFGIGTGDIVKAISGYMPVNNRSQFMNTGTNSVICDSYNANPVSMQLAISSFIGAEGEPKTMILGDMLELGRYAEEEHNRILDIVKGITGINLILVGPLFKELSANRCCLSFENVSELVKYLYDNPIRDNFVLVKGSRGINLDSVYPLL